jgi:hypothetical protein
MPHRSTCAGVELSHQGDGCAFETTTSPVERVLRHDASSGLVNEPRALGRQRAARPGYLLICGENVGAAKTAKAEKLGGVRDRPRRRARARRPGPAADLQRDEWLVARRYLSQESLSLVLQDQNGHSPKEIKEEVTGELHAA